MNAMRMTTTKTTAQAARPPVLARSIMLMKPVTWFPPTWAFFCGAIASGATSWQAGDLLRIVLGMVMAGPILCGLSQVINDYFDREVDALNEPNRLIPSGMISIPQVMMTIAILLLLGFGIALYLGRGIVVLVALGVLLAIAYSAPPLRAKRNGWASNTLAAISYEGLAWVAGHLAFATLTPGSLLIAALYSFGTHGIMSINDYKSIEGDRHSGIHTIPVLYGPRRAAWLIVMTMNLAQVGVIAAFLAWGQPITALIVAAILLAQVPLQSTFLKDPLANYLKFSAFGVLIFVLGMPVAANGLRLLGS